MQEEKRMDSNNQEQTKPKKKGPAKGVTNNPLGRRLEQKAEPITDIRESIGEFIKTDFHFFQKTLRKIRTKSPVKYLDHFTSLLKYAAPQLQSILFKEMKDSELDPTKLTDEELSTLTELMQKAKKEKPKAKKEISNTTIDATYTILPNEIPEILNTENGKTTNEGTV